MRNISSEDAFERCLEMLEQGASIEDCLQQFPEHRTELAALLKMVVRLDTIAEPAPLQRDQALRIAQKSYTQIQEKATNNAPQPTVLTFTVARLQRVTVRAAAVLLLLGAVALIVLNIDPTSDNDQSVSVSEVEVTPTIVQTTSPAPTEVTAVAASIDTDTPTATNTASATQTTRPTATQQPTESSVPPTAEPTVTPSHTIVTAQPTNIATIEATATTTDTPVPPTSTEPSALSAASRTSTPPTTTVTATVETTDEGFAVVVDLVGPVEDYDRATQSLQVLGTTVQFDIALPPGTRNGRLIAVSGNLTTDGTLEAKDIRTIDDVAFQSCEDISTDTIECRSLNDVLIVAFSLTPDELETLKAEFGVGDVMRAYTIGAITGTVRPETVLQARRFGLSWNAILERYAVETVLSNGVLIGDGRGGSIQATAATDLLVFDDTLRNDIPQSQNDDEPGQGSSGIPPGQGGDNPGQGQGPPDTPPGQGGDNPGQGQGPPDTPPGQGGDNPGQGQGPSDTPPGQGGDNPGQGQAH